MPGCEAPKGWTKQETSGSVRNSEIIAAISQISSTFVEEIQESKKVITLSFLVSLMHYRNIRKISGWV
jgi:hypothetical protein